MRSLMITLRLFDRFGRSYLIQDNGKQIKRIERSGYALHGSDDSHL